MGGRIGRAFRVKEEEGLGMETIAEHYERSMANPSPPTPDCGSGTKEVGKQLQKTLRAFEQYLVG